MTPDSIWQVAPNDYPHAACFDEVAIGLHAAFHDLGFPLDLVKGERPCSDRPLVIGANLVSRFRYIRVPSSATLFNLEQIDTSSGWVSQRYLELLRRYDVWDYSHQNVERLRILGIACSGVCSIGYHSILSRIKRNQIEDIDVLHYGSTNPRRLKILHDLRDAGLRVAQVFGAYGTPRDSIIARAKVALNLHFFEARIFEIVRVSFLLANGRCVVSETGTDPALESNFRDGVSFVGTGEIVEECRRLVNDESARAELAHQGLASFSAMLQRDALARVLARASHPQPHRGD